MPETSWRRIRETIFPGSEAGALSEERFQAAQPPNLANNIYSVDQMVSEREERSPTVQASLPSINSYPNNHIASDLSQLVPLQSDSGYQSMKRDTKEYLPTGVPEEGLIQANVKEAEQCISESPTDHDTMTVFSGASSMPADDLNDWKAELIRKLYNDLCLADATSESMQGLDDAVVSTLVRSFALRMGSVGSSKAEREIMLFVYRNREFVHCSALSRYHIPTDFRLGK